VIFTIPAFLSNIYCICTTIYQQIQHVKKKSRFTINQDLVFWMEWVVHINGLEKVAHGRNCTEAKSSVLQLGSKRVLTMDGKRLKQTGISNDSICKLWIYYTMGMKLKAGKGFYKDMTADAEWYDAVESSSQKKRCSRKGLYIGVTANWMWLAL